MGKTTRFTWRLHEREVEGEGATLQPLLTPAVSLALKISWVLSADGAVLVPADHGKLD